MEILRTVRQQRPWGHTKEELGPNLLLNSICLCQTEKWMEETRCRLNLWRDAGLKYTNVGSAAAGILAEHDS
jgi:hypothetical protein